MTIAESRPFQLRYVSRSASRIEDDTLAEIAAVSRQRNSPSGISGALLFDGQRFCQLLEGAEPPVRALMARIEDDPRHSMESIIAAEHFGLPRLTTHWRFGHCQPRTMDALAAAPLPKNEVALALFMSALATSADA